MMKSFPSKLMTMMLGMGMGRGSVQLQLCALNLKLSLSWNKCNQPPSLLVTTTHQIAASSSSSSLTKQGQRFLTKLAANSTSPSDTFIRRFVQGSPKSVSLSTLSHLLSPSTTFPHLSPLAFPLYARISEAPWFTWNPTIVADLAALLDELGRYEEAEALVSESTSRLESRKRDLALFYCKLLESYSKRSSERGFDVAYCYLNQLLRDSSSVFIKRRAYESMVSGLCAMDRPRVAEDLVDDLRGSGGIEPSAFELKSILYGYGRLGLFRDLQRVVDQMEKSGFEIDTVCANMVLSAYGTHGDHMEMVSWLQKMRSSGIPFSIRTYNSVSNSCPTIMKMMVELNELPLSIEALDARLEGGEAMVVRELLESCVILEELMVWDSLETKLDLHGCHLGSSYLIMLLWLEEMRRRLNDSNYGVPAEITLVCGSGKHSSVRGESPVKVLVKKMMVSMGSPLRIDRKNNGCFIAKGKSVKSWLCESRNASNASQYIYVPIQNSQMQTNSIHLKPMV